MRWTISKTVEINASPAEVFDVISDVELYSGYSPVIRQVKKAGDGSYRWVVSLAGIRMAWDGIVTRSEKPRYFAWRSVRGLNNTGTFYLAPTDRGTLVRLEMNFRVPVGPVLGLLKPFILPFIEKTGDDILQAVKLKLVSASVAGH